MNYNDQYAYYRRASRGNARCAVPADVPNPLGDAMRYSLLAGGKRLRPVLLLAAYAILQRDLTPGAALCRGGGDGAYLFADSR